MPYRTLLIVIVCVLFSTSLAHGQTTVETAYAVAEADVAPLRSFVHVYLRVAGVVWIAVEWIAAVFLILGYRLLRARVDAEGEGP